MSTRIREPVVYDLTVDEAAAYLKRTKDFVYRMANERHIAFTKAGRELRFSRHDLDNYRSRYL